MEPLQALQTLSQVVKSARLPYNDHVVLERCVDVLSQTITSKADSSNGIQDAEPVVFDSIEEAKPKKTTARARAKKGAK